MDEDTEVILESDFEIGQFFRERIIPRAVLYYTGESVEEEVGWWLSLDVVSLLLSHCIFHYYSMKTIVKMMWVTLPLDFEAQQFDACI